MLKFNLLAAAIFSLLAISALASEVTTNFNSDDVLSAQSLTDLKSAINDNNAKINALQGTPNLPGLYKVSQVGGFSDVAYIQLDANNFYTIYYEKGVNKLHSTSRGVYTTINNQLLLSGGLMNYNLTPAGQLTLSTPDFTTVAIKSTDDVSNWVINVNVIDSITVSTTSATDLAWDGTLLWMGNAYGGSNLFAINPSAHTISSSVSTTNYAWGVEWENGNLWLSDDGSENIMRFTLSGNTLTSDLTVSGLGPWVNAISWDGSNIWAYSDNNSSITKFNPATPTTLTVYNVPRLSGMTFIGGNLFVVASNAIHKLSTANFVSSASYYINAPSGTSYSIQGLAWDGSNMWASVSEYSSGTSVVKVLKLDLVP